ncbi:copper amine oxidase, enzyme [Hirsutella rhossiliensis]|uniref:Amine oxidase n=1 Tax=Hirsutella rhossiliensis TaxID=111463 RepID=A0A9P8MVB6_9HYPO|nr:copper amine oxidase, enzyme domain-containing protein [Hirsutella rhossiliensis]KAH0962858.1 copper amine oxidase, enzyme domain-containing protein [Hirsutella rhossiliensis]
MASCARGARIPHPFDPLEAGEIKVAVAVVREALGTVLFNAVALQEPRKADMVAWLGDRNGQPRPRRVADVVVIAPGGRVGEGLVDIDKGSLVGWEWKEGFQPIITVEELQAVEHIVRTDAAVIEQCEKSGISRDEMHKVYCDPWTIGVDERFGSTVRLQQALMYFRPGLDDCQYQYPLDFCPVYDAGQRRVVHIDVPEVRRPLRREPPLNYHPADVEVRGGYRTDLKPLEITQPEGVSFRLDGRELQWQNWRFHVGFGYREGIVLHDIAYNDGGTVRPIFYRLSLAEMVVPYGNPEHPHHRKHAFDLGEYGAGYLTNSLKAGCDCKGAIRYLDAAFPTRDGGVRTVANAICIHEEDAGLLFKHSDFRDDSAIATRARRLVVQHIFTAANYEYIVQWIFHQDGTIQPEIKLTGILNTYAINPDEDTHGWGTQVHPGVNAHNHQHLFCLRINPSVDGPRNTVVMVDAVPSDAPVGSAENPFGNAFGARRTVLATAGAAASDYAVSRTWDMCNRDRVHPYSGLPASYKLVSRDVPGLLPKPGSLVWKRAGFARHAVHVTKYRDDQLWPAGRHVPQTSGNTPVGLVDWIGDGSESVEDQDIVLWHTFGLNHFPSPEDFPIMPAESVTLLLRPRHFFTHNPVMDCPPSTSVTPSQAAAAAAAAAGMEKAD